MDTIDLTPNPAENAQDTPSEDPAAPKHSLRSAINQTCKDCIYDDVGGEGNWRQQVEKCTVSVCGLYQVRPISKPKKGNQLPSEE